MYSVAYEELRSIVDTSQQQAIPATWLLPILYFEY